jgi:hypothetical protein
MGWGVDFKVSVFRMGAESGFLSFGSIADGVRAMSKPLIEIELRLTGQGISVEEIASLVGLTPTKTWKRGEAIRKTNLSRKEDGWVFGIPQRETHDMEALLRELLDVLEMRGQGLAEATSRFSLSKEISFGVYVRDETPAAWFSVETLRRLAALDASLDIDVMLVG